MPNKKHAPRQFSDDGPSETLLRILAVIRRIPRGRIATYGDIAAAAGLPGRARLVGHILRSSSLANDVPWHRVVNASGRISERPGGGPAEQRLRLRREGLVFGTSGRLDLSRLRWKPGRSHSRTRNR